MFPTGSDHTMHPTNPTRSPLQKALVAVIAAYQRVVSPLLPRACRFHPSCSAYAAEAIETHGAAKGLLFAAGRLARCHPWCEGGVDPVPPRTRCAHDSSPVSPAMKGNA
jgi:putative membrane protein insertion efficiency factor